MLRAPLKTSGQAGRARVRDEARSMSALHTQSAHTDLEDASGSERANDDCPDEPDSAGVDAHLQQVIVVLLIRILVVPGQEVADGHQGRDAVEDIAGSEEEHGSMNGQSHEPEDEHAVLYEALLLTSTDAPPQMPSTDARTGRRRAWLESAVADGAAGCGRDGCSGVDRI